MKTKRLNIGLIINEKIWMFVIALKIKIKNNIWGPYTCIFHNISAPNLFSKNGDNIWEPSRGDNGIKLKTARVMLICINIIKNVLNEFETIPKSKNKRSKIAANTARIIFAIGPAAATFTISFFGSFKNLESTGTGFAHPNPTNRIINDPIISKCAIGFIVNLPIRAAVLSPQREAIQACANSWKDSANINIGINKTKSGSGRLKRMINSSGGVFYRFYSNAFYLNGYKSGL